MGYQKTVERMIKNKVSTIGKMGAESMLGETNENKKRYLQFRWKYKNQA